LQVVDLAGAHFAADKPCRDARFDDMLEDALPESFRGGCSFGAG
jgi:hypothetical protein